MGVQAPAQAAPLVHRDDALLGVCVSPGGRFLAGPALPAVRVRVPVSQPAASDHPGCGRPVDHQHPRPRDRGHPRSERRRAPHHPPRHLSQQLRPVLYVLGPDVWHAQGPAHLAKRQAERGRGVRQGCRCGLFAETPRGSVRESGMRRVMCGGCRRTGILARRPESTVEHCIPRRLARQHLPCYPVNRYPSMHTVALRFHHGGRPQRCGTPARARSLQGACPVSFGAHPSGPVRCIEFCLSDAPSLCYCAIPDGSHSSVRLRRHPLRSVRRAARWQARAPVGGVLRAPVAPGGHSVRGHLQLFAPTARDAAAVGVVRLVHDALVQRRASERQRRNGVLPPTRVLHINWGDRGRALLPTTDAARPTADYWPVGAEARTAELIVTHGTEGVTEPDGTSVRPLPPPDIDRLLRVGAERRVPLWCANPDWVTVVGGVNVTMPGTLAPQYEQYLREHGGCDAAQVQQLITYFGKPYPITYEAARRVLRPATQRVSAERRAWVQLPRGKGKHRHVPRTARDGVRILAVGDSLEHDIAGGHAANMDTLFIAGGIYGEEYFGLPADALGSERVQRPGPCTVREADMERLLRDTNAKVRPTFVSATYDGEERRTGDRAWWPAVRYPLIRQRQHPLCMTGLMKTRRARSRRASVFLARCPRVCVCVRVRVCSRPLGVSPRLCARLGPGVPGDTEFASPFTAGALNLSKSPLGSMSTPRRC
eukprot:ctg_2307.g570